MLGLELVNDSGPLLRVRGLAMESGYEALELVFPRGALRLTVISDSDEVEFQTVAIESDQLADLTSLPSFLSLVGKVVESAWSMRNHRGYNDAFQMRFLDLDTRAEETRQFAAAASTLTVAEVS